MVRSDDPEYRTPRLLLGCTFVVLGLVLLLTRLWGWSGTGKDVSFLALGCAQLVFGAVVAILAWRLPKRPRSTHRDPADVGRPR